MNIHEKILLGSDSFPFFRFTQTSMISKASLPSQGLHELRCRRCAPIAHRPLWGRGWIGRVDFYHLFVGNQPIFQASDGSPWYLLSFRELKENGYEWNPPLRNCLTQKIAPWNFWVFCGTWIRLPIWVRFGSFSRDPRVDRIIGQPFALVREIVYNVYRLQHLHQC